MKVSILALVVLFLTGPARAGDWANIAYGAEQGLSGNANAYDREGYDRLLFMSNVSRPTAWVPCVEPVYAPAGTQVNPYAPVFVFLGTGQPGVWLPTGR